MALPLLLGVAVVGLAVGAISLAVWRRHRDRSTIQTLASRLARAYDPSANSDLDTLPLRRPEGRVAVRRDGLYLHIGSPPEEMRHVPWSRLNNVVPVVDGRFMVEVSRVGPIEISGEAGRRMWEVFRERQTRTQGGRSERARAVRV